MAKRLAMLGISLCFVLVAQGYGWGAPPVPCSPEGPPQPDALSAEFAALQGTWRCLRWEQYGTVMSEADRRTVSVVVKGKTYRSTVDGVNFKEGPISFLDPTTTPHQLDAPFAGGINRSIYIRTGDYLISCVGGPRRPTEFVCGGETGGDSLYVFKIER